MPWDLEDRNLLHKAAKEKLIRFLRSPERVIFTRTAERDMAEIPLSAPLTKLQLLDLMIEFIESGKTLNGDYMDSGDEAFIFRFCMVENTHIYVKTIFAERHEQEILLIVSSHPDRKW